MWGFSTVLFFLGAVPCIISTTEADYYWREYTGVIPKDAVVGGKNINGKNIYIGQAYIKNAGLMVVQINEGVKEVAAPLDGVKKVSRFIKILCGKAENFYWLSTNSTNLHLDLIDKIAVIGGQEDAFGTINIGRISYEGGAQIGKINSFSVGHAGFRWADIFDKEPGANSYEVLINEVRENGINVDLRIKDI